MYGESVLIWSKSDYDNYSKFRSETDSLLVCLKQSARELLLTGQIDTLRQQLLQKESRLHNLMNIIQRENMTDSILESRIHSILRKSSDVRKIIRKRKGLAGLFGKKDTLYIPYKSDVLLNVSDTMTFHRTNQNKQIEALVSSLRVQNKMFLTVSR